MSIIKKSLSKVFLVCLILSLLLGGCYSIKYLFYKPTSLEFQRNSSDIQGSMFLRQTSYLPAEVRESRIEEELLKGNMPSFLKNMVPIKFYEKRHSVTIWVSKDYLSIGSDRDYVRIPTKPSTAEKVAKYYGMALPTAKIVDKIYAYSKLKLTPAYLSPGPAMSSNAYYRRHNDIINKNLKTTSLLVSGHKKDIVITNRLIEKKPKRVAIYGWHRPNGKPVQPLSVVHDSNYADYSHGIRLISRKVLIDSKEYSYESVLSDKNLAPLLSYEGIIKDCFPY